MCIIIDTNCLGAVFNVEAENHNDFMPVLDWILNGKGKIVFGGSKYEKELKGKFIKLFSLMKKAGKAVYIDNSEVNNEELVVSGIIPDRDFDDQHLVALLRISKCKLICSLDDRAYPYFTHDAFFSPSKNKPKIYRSAANKAILIDKNIADICKPCQKTTNNQRSTVSSLL